MIFVYALVTPYKETPTSVQQRVGRLKTLRRDRCGGGGAFEMRYEQQLKYSMPCECSSRLELLELDHKVLLP